MVKNKESIICGINIKIKNILDSFFVGLFMQDKNYFFNPIKKYNIILSINDYKKYNLEKIIRIIKAYYPDICIYASNMVKNSPCIVEKDKKI